MSALAVATDSINLGQGFPDSDGPQEVLDAAVEAIRAGHNQYPPGPGTPELRAAIGRHQQRFYGLDLDPDGEVLVTAGATEALAGALLGMLDTGDEVIVFEPMYDSYQACIALAGARAVPVLLQPDGDRYGFDADELRSAVSPRTRLILLNTPHNPTGKVFDADELTMVADVAIEHDLIVVTDEVYEHLVFPGAVHIPMATLPGMAERTLTISSGGKTFNTTGWKVGWMCGPRPLVAAARTAKQFLTYVNGAPFQPAIAAGLDLDDEFYAAIAADLTTKRDHLVAGLRRAGFTTYSPKRRTSRPSTFVLSTRPETAWRSAGRFRSGAASWRSPTRCSTPGPNMAAISCASPAASGSRFSTRRCGGSDRLRALRVVNVTVVCARVVSALTPQPTTRRNLPMKKLATIAAAAALALTMAACGDDDDDDGGDDTTSRCCGRTPPSAAENQFASATS